MPSTAHLAYLNFDLRIEPWGQDALRVRAARGGELPEPLGEDGALLDVGSPLTGFLAGLARFVLGPTESVLTALGAGSRGR